MNSECSALRIFLCCCYLLGEIRSDSTPNHQDMTRRVGVGGNYSEVVSMRRLFPVGFPHLRIFATSQDQPLSPRRLNPRRRAFLGRVVAYQNDIGRLTLLPSVTKYGDVRNADV